MSQHPASRPPQTATSSAQATSFLRGSVADSAAESAVHAKAIALATAALEISAASGLGNPTVAMGAAHAVATLLHRSMRWDPANPRDAAADRLLHSDATLSPVVYAAIAELGVPVLTDGAWRPLVGADLAGYGTAESPLSPDPDPAGCALFTSMSGGAGDGLSRAVGEALAARAQGSGRRHFVLVTEAELRLGKVAEALAHLVEERLTTVVPVFLVAPSASSDRTSGVDGPDALVRRLSGMGFDAREVDGHRPSALLEAFAAPADPTPAASLRAQPPLAPVAVVVRCTQGWGARSLQGGAWFGRIPTGDRLKTALEELRGSRVSLVRSFAGELARPEAPASSSPAAPRVSMIDAAGGLADFAAAMRDADMYAVYQSGRLSTRRAHALALRGLGRAHEGVTLLQSDGRRNGIGDFLATDRALATRTHDFRGATGHMLTTAGAMAAAGRAPFVVAPSGSLLRGAAELAALARAGAAVRLVATDAGLGAIASGPASVSVDDVAFLRALSSRRDASGNPAAYLLQPADAFAAYALTLAAAEHDGFVTMRLPEGEQEFLYNGETVFNLGKFEVLFEGRDLLIVTAGALVHEVNRALDDLDRAGIEATIVDLYSIPFDEEALLDLANENGGRILVVEDSAGGALASAVSEACTAAGDAFTVESMRVSSPVAPSRTPAEAFAAARLSATDLVTRATRMIGVERGR
jgi:transketolase